MMAIVLSEKVICTGEAPHIKLPLKHIQLKDITGFIGVL